MSSSDPAGGDSQPPHLVECRVTLLLDGVEEHFDMSPGDESVLHAALDAGLSPPYACMQGICGSCRARLVSGEVSMDEALAITAEEQANGVILVCRSRPTTARLTISFEDSD